MRIINRAKFHNLDPPTHQVGATLSAHFVSPDVELPLASVRVALQQGGAHGEDLLHDGVLPQVVLTLSAARGQRSQKSQNSRQGQVDAGYEVRGLGQATSGGGINTLCDITKSHLGQKLLCSY